MGLPLVLVLEAVLLALKEMDKLQVAGQEQALVLVLELVGKFPHQ